MKGEHGLADLALNFALLSLFAIGGVNAVVPEIHRQAVVVAGWVTDRQFADLFAIAQVMPGPNVMIATLVGYQVSGVAGALVGIGSMCLPSCVLTFLVARTWQRFQDARWRVVAQAALVPISIGLIAASAFLLARAADQSVAAFGLTAATAVFAYFTRFNPLWIFAAAATLGYFGLV